LELRIQKHYHKSINQACATPDAPNVSQAFDKFEQKFLEEEGRRRAVNALRERSDEPPRESKDEEVAADVATTPDFPLFKKSPRRTSIVSSARAFATATLANVTARSARQLSSTRRRFTKREASGMSLNVARRVPAQRAYLVRPIIRHRIPGADDGVLAVPEV
jgi:hypothetical protein